MDTVPVYHNGWASIDQRPGNVRTTDSAGSGLDRRGLTTQTSCCSPPPRRAEGTDIRPAAGHRPTSATIFRRVGRAAAGREVIPSPVRTVCDAFRDPP